MPFDKNPDGTCKVVNGKVTARPSTRADSVLVSIRADVAASGGYLGVDVGPDSAVAQQPIELSVAEINADRPMLGPSTLRIRGANKRAVQPNVYETLFGPASTCRITLNTWP